MPDNTTHLPDPWLALRRHTAARIALGRAGASLPTEAVLDFAIAHAEARDAVHTSLNVAELQKDLAPLGLPVVVLSTLALDRQMYLHRPDLGRRLDEESRTALARFHDPQIDVAIMIADGLSAPAAQKQATPVLRELLPTLRDKNLRVGPICIIRQGRVAVQDEVGNLLAAKAAVILIGERPGLGTSQSLGAYLVFAPRPGRTDAQRNCISNIRPGGLSAGAAATTLHYLLCESLRLGISGVGLKDEQPAAPALESRPTIR